MPRLIVFSMVLAFAGAYAYAESHGGGVDASMDDSARAVEDTEMNVAMMEGVPEVMDEEMPMASAPSVALSGEAKMGLKRVDDNTSTKPEDDDIKTVVEYQVTFSSEGVTDGGLKFGASISIDEEGKGAADKNGVNAASVHIGAADGTWKLQFGSNDPGIDKVGNVGLADADNISGMTKTIVPLMYKDGSDNDAMKRVVYIPTFHQSYGGKTAVMEHVKDINTIIFAANGGILVTTPPIDVPVSYVKQKEGGLKYDLSRANAAATTLTGTITGTDMPAPPPGRTAIALTGTIDSFSYALTAGEGGSDTWSAGVKYDSGVFYVSAGGDSNDVLAVGAGGTFAGNTVKATYVKQDGETYQNFITGIISNDTVTAIIPKIVNEMEAMGLSVSRDIGAGSNIALTYSRLTDKGIQGPFVGTKQWELDFTYDLGGGASFYAGIEQANKSMFNDKYNVKVAGSPASTTQQTFTATAITKKSKVTTLETGITMKF